MKRWYGINAKNSQENNVIAVKLYGKQIKYNNK